MTSFEMIKYYGQEYPADVPLRIEEIAAHFDITSIGGRLEKSLHTEYSYRKRALNSPLIMKCPELATAHKDRVPQLWKNEQWAAQFANFIIELKGIDPTPKVTTTTFLLNSNPASRSTYSCESHQQTPLGASFCFQRGGGKNREDVVYWGMK